MQRIRFFLPVVLLGALLSAGCSEPPAGERVDENGADEATLDGLSREQIQEQARPMSPEQAEELGIIDTIVDIPSPAAPDSEFLRPPVLPDSGAAPPPSL